MTSSHSEIEKRQNLPVTYWKVKKGADRRIRSQHPWVFSNELEKSPKGHFPGYPVLLIDHEEKFLAAGYGNPHSLISFRALSFDSNDKNFFQPEYIAQKVLSSWRQRHSLGFHHSFRMTYGEGDFLPGIVIDRYVVKNESGNKAQLFAIQILTYGLHLILDDLKKFFGIIVEAALNEGLSPFTWDETAIVIRNDVNIRKLEGLPVEAPKVFKELADFNLSDIQIFIDAEFTMSCDLIEGQKTGFFLDQVFNISLMCDLLKKSSLRGKKIRILDLCCYVGHWSSRIAHEVTRLGGEVESWAVDVSEPALRFAEKNIRRAGGEVKILKQDVLENLSMIPEGQFDIVIADPPAFIKNKKDIPTGTHAYLKMNTSAFKFAKAGGLVASCSCSGLFEESMLRTVVEKAIRRNQRQARCISHGGHSADHPVLLSFSEGFYLKMFIHHIC